MTCLALPRVPTSLPSALPSKISSRKPMARAKSTNKPKKGDDNGDPKKRGNPGDFHGARRAWLFSRLDEYCKQSAEKTTRTWWADLWRDYWATFPWEIPINQEPPEDLTGYGRPDGALTEEEKAQKTKTMGDTQIKIKRWLSYARRAKGGANPFAKWLAQLRRVEDRAPKRLATYQVYMQDEENNARINELFEERFPEEVGKRGTIKFRGRIARELLEEEDEEIKEEYRQKVEEEYEDAMAEFKAGAGADVAENEAEIQAEAREHLAVTVQPLLDAIRAITGSQVLMVTGAVVNGKFDVRGLHAKAPGTQGLDFTAWDPKGYKGVLDQWMRYLHAAGTRRKKTRQGRWHRGKRRPCRRLPTPTIPPPTPTIPPPTPTVPPSAPATPPPPAAPSASSPTSSAAAGGASDPPPPSSNEGGEGAETEDGPAAVGGDGGEGEGGDGGEGEDEEEEYESMDTIVGRLDGWSDIRSPLKRKIRAMSPDSAYERVDELRRRDVFFRRRESNIAEREELLTTMAPSQELRKANKRPREGGDEVPSGKRVKRAAQDEPGDEDEYEDGEGDDEEGEEENGKGKRVRQSVEENGVPHWASTSREQLLEGEGGEVWEAVVDLWWRLEQAAKFKGPAKGANASIRPAEVKGWVARARKGGPVPAVRDLISFGSTWWKWWCAINPKWRERYRDGHRLAQKSDDSQSWAALAKQTGPNGLLFALICLRWWKDAAGKKGDPVWEEALKKYIGP
ncbi:hypothetical protein R3P38DRAFT_2769899 [Favolaschia claudopus]|uniref:Uncharacterized protein n=1 Tax=Favolaschia claudopus TaxID=2862362 RepID=A0AAW0CMN8_9AGAR